MSGSYYRQILDKLDLLVKSRFIEMFGDVISNAKQWPTMPITEAAPITQNKNYGTKESNWLLNLDAIEPDTGKVLFKNYVTKEELDGSICSFTEKHVLYSKLRPYLNKVVIPDESGYGTTELLPLLPKPGLINQQYLATALMSDAFVAKFSTVVAGTKMPRISMDTFKKFQLPIPSMNLQEEFDFFVKQVDKSKF